jgi:hypothetical protein
MARATIVYNDKPDYHIYKDLADWDEKRGDGRICLEICDDEGRVVLDAPIEAIDFKNKRIIYNFGVEIPKEVFEQAKVLGVKFYNES